MRPRWATWCSSRRRDPTKKTKALWGLFHGVRHDEKDKFGDKDKDKDKYRDKFGERTIFI